MLPCHKSYIKSERIHALTILYCHFYVLTYSSQRKTLGNKRFTSHNGLPRLFHVRLRCSFVYISFGRLRRTDRPLSVLVERVGRETRLAKQPSCDQHWNTPSVTFQSFVLMNYRCNTSTANNRRIF